MGGSEAWDPATTGGVASIGVFGLPFGPLLLWLALVALVIALRHRLRGGSIGGPYSWLNAARRTLRPDGRTSWHAVFVGLLLVWTPLSAARLFLGAWDPLSAADPYAPGPMVAEVLHDGQWQDDEVDEAASWSWSEGEPCLSECSGPRYLYRVQPDEPYWWLESVRNDGPLPVTLLGRPDMDLHPSPFGLALLRDPAVLSAEPANLRAFEPVLLGPGATVTVAFTTQGERCADPAGSSGWGRYMTAHPLIYDVLGWRREGDVWPHVSVTEAGCQ